VTAFWIIIGYLVVLLGLGIASNRLFRGTMVDYFLASRGVGPVMLLMSLFGTTMTAFAMVGSSGEASQKGIGVYGLMASSSGIVHSLCFFLVGVKLWSYGKKYGYLTQIEFFRDRFDSSGIGLVLFPILVLMLIPYLLTGIIGLGNVISGVTIGAFPTTFVATKGAVPAWLGEGIIVGVVLLYIFIGGVRSTMWVNAFQNVLFISVGIITVFVVANKLGGFQNATKMVLDKNPSLLKRTFDPQDRPAFEAKVARYEANAAKWKETKIGPPPKRPVEPGISQLEFLSYLLIPLSVATFPHLFQYYLTAKSAKTFRLSVVAHPIFIMLTWVPCIMLGVWATSAVVGDKPVVPPDIDPNKILAVAVKNLTGPLLGGLMAAGILATNSLDAQFLVLGNMFTNDIVAHYLPRKRFTEKQLLFIGRAFVVGIVIVTYLMSLYEPRSVFRLGAWCFSGFASLAPLTLGALYWRRATKWGAYASILAAGISWFWLFQDSDWGQHEDYLVFGMLPVAPIVAASTLALVLVSMMSKPPGRPTIEKFFAKSR
jgi:SSS family solute:Na+ symporter